MVLDPLTAALAAIGTEKALEATIDKLTDGDKEKEKTPIVVNVEMPPLKGKPVFAWQAAQAGNGLADNAVYCGNYNAVNVRIEVTGTTPSATISVEGAAEKGANYRIEADPAATRTLVTASTSFDCMVANSWAKVRIAAISGTYAAGQGYTIIVTPFVSAGGYSLSNVQGEVITLLASAARTADGNGTAIAAFGWRKRYLVVMTITASATAANDTLDAYVDVSLEGTTFLNAIHFTQQAGNGSARTEFAILDASAPGTSVVNVTSDAASGVVRPALFGPVMRPRWVIVDGGGADQSHTFGIQLYAI